MRDSFPEIKKPERDDYSSPSSAEVKKMWNYNFISPNVPSWCGKEQLYFFTFTLDYL
jgi:hypothetical protein